jgi:hypothetical protein
MNSQELAKTKIERAIEMSSEYDSLDEGKLKEILLCVDNALKVLPRNDSEKEEMQSLVSTLLSMDVKKYGYVFKANSWKNSMIINKDDIIELVWRARSLLY